MGTLTTTCRGYLVLDKASGTSIITCICNLFSTTRSLGGLIPKLAVTLNITTIPTVDTTRTDNNDRHLSALLGSVFGCVSLVSFNKKFCLSLLSRRVLALLCRGSGCSVILNYGGIMGLCNFVAVLFSLSNTTIFTIRSIKLTSGDVPSFTTTNILHTLLGLHFISSTTIGVCNGVTTSTVTCTVVLTTGVFLLTGCTNIGFTIFHSLLVPNVYYLTSCFTTGFVCKTLFSNDKVVDQFLLLNVVCTLYTMLLAVLSGAISFSRVGDLTGNGGATWSLSFGRGL